MSWRRILLLGFLFLVVLGTTTGFLLHRNDATTSYIRRLLAEQIAASFALDDVSLDLANGAVALHGLRITDPTRPQQQLLSIQRLQVDLNPTGSGLQIAPHRLLAEGLQLDLGPQLPLPEQLLRQANDGNATAKPLLPDLSLRRGSLRYQPTPHGTPFELQDIDGELTAIAARRGQFALACTAYAPDLGAVVRVDGEIGLHGRTWLTVSVQDTGIDSDLLRRVEEHLAYDLGGLEVNAQLEELQLRVEVEATANQVVPSFVVRSRLRHLRATANFLPRQIRDASVDLAIDIGADSKLVAQVTQELDGGTLELALSLQPLLGQPTYTIRARGQSLPVDADTVAALRLFELGNELMEALQPSAGRVDVDIFLAFAAAERPIAEFDLSLRDVAMAYHGFGRGTDRLGFPLPLVGAAGRVRLRDGVLGLEQLRATIAPAAGGGAVQLDGRIATRLPGSESTVLDIAASGVELGPSLRDALRGLYRQADGIYDQFAPSGRADVAVQIRPHSNLAGGFHVRVEPRDASMCWSGFPYRLQQLGGTVAGNQQRIDFDLRGAAAGGRLQLRGSIPLAAMPQHGIAGFRALIEVADLPIDDELRQAMCTAVPPLQQPWQQAAPNGRLHGEIRLHRASADSSLQHDARLRFVDGAMQLPVAGWHIRGLHGEIHALGEEGATQLQLQGLVGELAHTTAAAGRVALFGKLQHAGTTHGELALTLRRLPLDAALGATLEELGALPAGSWQALQPGGHVDVGCDCSIPADGPPRLAFAVQLLDVSSTASILPQALTQLTGGLQVRDGELRFARLAGQLGAAAVVCSDGRIGPAAEDPARTEIRSQIHCQGLVLDSGLANLFGGPMQSAVLERQLRGKADIDQLAVRLLLPAANGETLDTWLTGRLQLYDTSLLLGSARDGIRLDGIQCLVALDPSHLGDHGGQLSGSLGRGSLRLFGQPLDDIDARFLVDATRMQVFDLGCRWQGGRLQSGDRARPAMQFQLPAPATPHGVLSADLGFSKVDLSNFLRDCGLAHAPYSGQCSGRLQLAELRGTAVASARGQAELLIERGDLGAVPLFTAIYAQLPAPERPRFHRLEANCRLEQQRLQFEHLALRSNLLAVKGNGHLDLDGHVDVELKLDNLLGPGADPLLLPLIDSLTRYIVSFHLHGHLRQLQATRRWVTERSPARRRVPPMPPPAHRLLLPAY